MEVIWVIELKCGKHDKFDPMMGWCFRDRASARLTAKLKKRNELCADDYVRIRKYVREEKP